jgi:hypothetical protein
MNIIVPNLSVSSVDESFGKCIKPDSSNRNFSDESNKNESSEKKSSDRSNGSFIN